MAGELDVRLLGPVEVRVDERPIPLGGPRQAALVALLASRAGATIRTERLLEDLWAGEPPDGAATTLRSYVSRLRPTLGDRASIRGSRDGYRLEVPPDTVDARRF